LADALAAADGVDGRAFDSVPQMLEHDGSSESVAIGVHVRGA
jgi:hypothetical protein